MRAARQALRDLLRLSHPVAAPEAHLEAALRWLCRAQDVGPDDGVARMFHLKTGWGASYPETTGYIIPTFLDYARFTGDPAYAERALRMADWEAGVQMDTGAVQGGTIADQPPTPAVFNTGQVIFGWYAAYRHAKGDRHLKALVRAADFLCRIQDPDGAWRRDLSRFCNAPVDTFAYNVRTAWALLLAADLTGADRYLDCATRKLHFTVGLTGDNGWTDKNCLSDPTRPLLHTIGYTFQGMLECATLLDDREARDAVVTGCTRLAESFDRDGGLFGRYDRTWRRAVRWRCLTGEAQVAIVWFRLSQLTGQGVWADRARRLNRGLARTQARSGDPDTAGGIRGSVPVWGPYGEYEYLNWAAKFYADALMLEAGLDKAAITG